jgi:predicted nicotinamide N-methyase
MADKSMDELEAQLRGQFVVVTERIACGGSEYQILHPRSADELIDEEEFKIDERLPYWAEVWPSARVLAERLACEAGMGRRLLELGCGCGYVSLIAARRGFDVVATDYYLSACQFVRLNAARHALEQVTPRHADWRYWPDDLGRFDLVVAADVLYDQEYCKLVAGVMARALSPSGRGIVTDPGRRRAANFLDECAAQGLAGARVSRVPFDNGVDKPTVDVYELTWKRGANDRCDYGNDNHKQS